LTASIILAIPVTMLTLDWSTKTAVSLYAGITKTLHLHTPSVTRIDEQGIPMVDYGYQEGNYTGPQRNPLTVATKAIEYFTEYNSQPDEQIKQYGINCINWLEKEKIERQDYLLWSYDFDLPTYGVKAPIYSAMAQARIMVAFERAFELTKDPGYLQLANQTLKSLSIPIQDGGVLAVDPEDGGKWFEEVASKKLIPSPLILNGNIFVLFDLYDYYQKTASGEAKSLFDEGIIELKRHLGEYDTGHWTYYDRIGNLAYDYHYVHVEQMQKLFDITSDIVFKEYHDKWHSYFPFNPMWARIRFAAFLLDAVLIFIGLLMILEIYHLIRKKRRVK
jgi:heparosan-N-sulfate-glucuronate 5-epimerase